MRKRTDQDALAQKAGLEGEVDACLAALPVVTRQLGETRAQIEAAVVEVCSSFQGIASRASESVREASAVLGSGEGGGAGRLDRSLEATQATFDRLLARMEEGLERSRRAVKQIERVTAAVARIEEVLVQVEDVANSTRLLTVNAKIQASHAGAHGRAFVIIAESISELSEKSGAVVLQVRGNLEEVGGAVSEVTGELAEMARSDHAAVETNRTEIGAALEVVRQSHLETRAGLERASRTGDELAHEIHRAVTAMQFQDRISQRIEHLSRALGGMSAALAARRAGEAQAAGTGDHLAELERSYTMAEEATANAGPRAGGGDVVLF